MRRVVLTVVLCGLPSLGWADTRRFALIAGANDGGGDREELRYAVSDAEEFGSVLEDLGGVPRSNQTLLIEPGPEVLREAIGNLAETVENAEAIGMRTEVVVYFSGHSDENGLLLGEKTYPYVDLRRDLEAIAADVQVVVLDSCASGALVRTKGGVRRPAFLEDQSVDVTGTAYLMSSSADESAQESDRIGGSYFTHYLVSGLRGGADMSGDGRVTLNEAYVYAKAETLKRTESSSIGAQHAEHYTHLKGKGDFVFTDLAATTSLLVLDEAVAGRIFIRDDDRNLIAELNKPADRDIELALRPGTYTVLLELGVRRMEAVFQINANENLMAADLTFEEIESELTVARGRLGRLGRPTGVAALPQEPEAPPAPPSPPEKVRNLQVGLGVAKAPSARAQIGLVGATTGTLVGTQITGVFSSAGTANGAQLSIFSNHVDELAGAQFTIGVNIARSTSIGWQQALGMNLALGDFRGAQVALINVGEEVKGVQVGLVNRASAAHGLQLGLVNAGGNGDGLQIGLVNVAGNYRGASVGLVTVHKEGYNHLFLNGGTIDPVGIGATWGSKYLYTNVMLGGLRHRFAPSVAIGIGGHIPMRKFYLDVDGNVGYRGGQREEFDGGLLRFRVQPGLALGEHVGLQTGVVLEANDFEFTQDRVSVGWTVGLRL